MKLKGAETGPMCAPLLTTRALHAYTLVRRSVWAAWVMRFGMAASLKIRQRDMV